MESVSVILVNLPPKIKAFTRANLDGSYTVIVNACLCLEAQRAAYKEEIKHIQGGDFFSEESANFIECMRHV